MIDLLLCTCLVAPPMITKQPTGERITALQNVTFTCEANGFKVKYEWKRHSGSSVTSGRQSSLTIARATPLDRDQYYCVAMTEGGYAFSKNVTLIVNGKIYHYIIVNLTSIHLKINLLVIVVSASIWQLLPAT